MSVDKSILTSLLAAQSGWFFQNIGTRMVLLLSTSIPWIHTELSRWKLLSFCTERLWSFEFVFFIWWTEDQRRLVSSEGMFGMLLLLLYSGCKIRSFSFKKLIKPLKTSATEETVIFTYNGWMGWMELRTKTGRPSEKCKKTTRDAFLKLEFLKNEVLK